MTTSGHKEVKFRHGFLAFAILAIIMSICVVGLHTEPQIPLVMGCVGAGAMAFSLGYTWDEILDGMVKGITDSLEAVLILMAIGMLVGVWIASGTVPTMIVYGLEVITPELFLPLAFIVTLLVGLVLGSWGAAGTIGIAFLGIAAALGVSLPVTAGAIVAAAYVSEIVSPLVDGPNLCAAISGCGVFDLCKKFLGLVVVVCLGCTAVYYFMGTSMNMGGDVTGSGEVASLLSTLKETYNITPLTLIPLLVMIVCVAVKMPAIPAFLIAIALGMVEAVTLQGSDWGLAIEAANVGVISQTGFEAVDTLLSNGGIQVMMPTISIVILVMAYGGIMQHTHLMDAMIEPIVSKLHSMASLITASVGTGAFLNVLLPDQYPAISMSCQMYGKEYERRGIAPEVWANIVNSSAGITSVLIPWNTCAIYMVTVLGVSCLAYAPYAFFCYLYPLAVILVTVIKTAKVSGRKSHQSENQA